MRQLPYLLVAFVGLTLFMPGLAPGQVDRQTALTVKTDSIEPPNIVLYASTDRLGPPRDVFSDGSSLHVEQNRTTVPSQYPLTKPFYRIATQGINHYGQMASLEQPEPFFSSTNRQGITLVLSR